MFPFIIIEIKFHRSPALLTMLVNLIITFTVLRTFQAQHIWYTDDGYPGDILINEVFIRNSSSTTYYETLGWNQGGVAGGYTGSMLTSLSVILKK